MSDQETAIQLIRNEAAELIVRAKAAGLSVHVVAGRGPSVVEVKPNGYDVFRSPRPAALAPKEPK